MLGFLSDNPGVLAWEPSGFLKTLLPPPPLADLSGFFWLVFMPDRRAASLLRFPRALLGVTIGDSPTLNVFTADNKTHQKCQLT